MTDNSDLKTIIRQMFEAWCFHENSWNTEQHHYTQSSDDCYLEVAKGDKIRAGFLDLFSYWSNDIQDLAAHLGIGLRRVDDASPLAIFEVPPPPSPEAWWDVRESRWVEDTARMSTAAKMEEPI